MGGATGIRTPKKHPDKALSVLGIRAIEKPGRYADGQDAPAPRPGMSAVVRLQVREADDAVTVPAAAVFSADGRDVVWVDRGGKAERVPVTVGVQGADVVEIVTGVQAGQRIVVSGADLVRSGQDLP